MTQLTETWLRQTGFLWSQDDRQPFKHWLLWICQACIEPQDGYRFLTSPDDLGIEVSQIDEDGKSWHCWLRADYAGRYSRLLHIRTVSTVEDVTNMIAGLTGRPWNPDDVLYGSLRSPEMAEALRKDAERLDQRIAAQQMKSVIAEQRLDPHQRKI